MEYKKILSFVVVLTLLIGLASAITIDSRSRSSTGAAFTAISSDKDVSAPNSLRLFAGEITNFPPTNEARFRVNFDSSTTLSDLNSISWMQFVESGYASHVDVFLDINGNGVYDSGTDDVLVFEYAKVNPSLGCDDSGDYPDSTDGIINTFGDKGIVDDSAWAWLNSGPPGGCSSPATEFFWHTLSAWKSGPSASEANGKTISGSTKVLAIEIEIDGWIATSDVFVDDVRINGELVENFDGTQQVDVEITELVLVSLSPVSLNFGPVSPGTSDNPATNGPINLDATGSNTDVRVEVTDVTGFPFDTGLKLDGDDTPIGNFWNLLCVESGNVCTYSVASTTPTLSIPVGATTGLKSGVITYTFTAQPPSS